MIYKYPYTKLLVLRVLRGNGMKYALDGHMAKEVDNYTINSMGVPSVVLMERAAVAVATKVAEIATIFNRNVKIAAVCGNGNNGADALAVARILSWQGLNVDIIEVGNFEKLTKEYEIQRNIAKNSGLIFVTADSISEYDIIVDGIFGVGLSRNIEGSFVEIIKQINDSNNIVVSVDVPSGINATTGEVMGIAVNANATVTFGYHKTGLLLNSGKLLSGEITVADIGFCPEAIKNLNPPMYFTIDDIRRIPKRIPDSNKGTYGRTVIIAGSEDMSGAAYLSAIAAFKTGAGLVEIISHKNNTDILKKLLPEAIVKGYDEDNYNEIIMDSLSKAKNVILGPGLSMADLSVKIVASVFEKGQCPLIIDADALNIISNDISILKSYKSTVIITPHIKELERLSGANKNDMLSDSVSFAKEFANANNVILVMKNSVTVVAENGENKRTYINTSGCAAMSKAGMGDVLTGIIAGMLSLKLEPFSAASMGVYIHGLAGEIASSNKGEHSLLASELTDEINTVMKM